MTQQVTRKTISQQQGMQIMAALIVVGFLLATAADPIIVYYKGWVTWFRLPFVVMVLVVIESFRAFNPATKHLIIYAASTALLYGALLVLRH